MNRINSKIRHPYLSVNKSENGSYGGSQTWFENQIIRQGGCGLIGAADVLLYLGLYKKGCQTKYLLSLEFDTGKIRYQEYETYVRRMFFYFPVIPYFGIPGWMLPLGFQRYFLKHRIQLRARWGVRPKSLREKMNEMLQMDIPVLLSIGPNFPFPFGKHKLQLYRRTRSGNYLEAQKTNAHYVVVTGIEGEWIHISSWGREYYIHWDEYREYVKKYSNYLFSNICYISAKK